MKIRYIDRRFSKAVMAVIDQANEIIIEYESAGYDLTLRQLYYQFVARDLIPNSQKEYKKLGDTINNARLAGLVSWNAIVDRTRNLQRNAHWENARSFMDSVVPQFSVDKWKNQPYRLEVWIEKDALIGIAERVCEELDVPYFSCRGYTSQSEMWSAAQRLNLYYHDGQKPIIIHLGDHDPSGKDMSRDIQDRLNLFCPDADIQVERIALNMDQIEEYNPPPNPAKLTDARADAYIAEFGDSSWELDALDPKVLSRLIQDKIFEYRDVDLLDETMDFERAHRKELERFKSKLK